MFVVLLLDGFKETDPPANVPPPPDMKVVAARMLPFVLMAYRFVQEVHPLPHVGAVTYKVSAVVSTFAVPWVFVNVAPCMVNAASAVTPPLPVVVSFSVTAA
jgi:hypothetical protein